MSGAEAGWYPMHRGWMEHPLFARDEFSRAQAWEWLIAKAAWADTTLQVGQREVPVQRGQLIHAIRFLATAWRWEEKRVRRFLARLRDEGMICLESAGQNAGHRTLVTISNYSRFQALESETAAPSDRDLTGDRRREEERKKEEDLIVADAREPRGGAGEINEGWQVEPAGQPAAEECEVRALKVPPERPPPEPPPIPPDPVEQIITAFDRTRAELYPDDPPRAKPHDSDQACGERWLRMGAGCALDATVVMTNCLRVMRAVMVAGATSGREPPATLRYCDGAMKKDFRRRQAPLFERDDDVRSMPIRSVPAPAIRQRRDLGTVDFGRVYDNILAAITAGS